jgi:hypothetical protein
MTERTSSAWQHQHQHQRLIHSQRKTVETETTSIDIVDDGPSENEMVALFFVLVVVLILLILLTYIHCQRLQQTLLKRKRWKEEHNMYRHHSYSGNRKQHHSRRINSNIAKTTSSLSTTNTNTTTIGEAHTTVQQHHQASYQELRSEMEHLRQIQQSVRKQMSMLQGYVEQKQQVDNLHRYRQCPASVPSEIGSTKVNPLSKSKH